MSVIADLLRRVTRDAAGAPRLVDAFLARHGSPWVEDGVATFFFLHDQPFDAVYLVHWVFGLESRIPFQKLPNTDAWFLTLDLPRAARVEYKLEVHRHGHAEWIKDPRNPHRAFDPFGSNSVCRMDGYADPPWVHPQPEARSGTLDGFSLKSDVWGDTRDVQLWLPGEYRAHKTYPLVICHDGADYLRFAGLRTVLENLVHRHEVRPFIVAFTNGVRRNEEYAANPLQARFVVEELLPALQARHHISDDPRDRGLMGASFGAVTSLYTAWSYPGVFGKLLLQSGSFVFTDVGRHNRGPLWDPVVDFVNAFRQDPSRTGAQMYLSCGIFESLIYYNRSLTPLLREAHVEHRFEETLDGHNWIGWRDKVRNGLTWLFPGHLWMTYD